MKNLRALAKAVFVFWGASLGLAIIGLVMLAPVIALTVFFVRMLWRA